MSNASNMSTSIALRNSYNALRNNVSTANTSTANVSNNISFEDVSVDKVKKCDHCLKYYDSKKINWVNDIMICCSCRIVQHMNEPIQIQDIL